MGSPMVATLQKAEPTAANEPLVSETFSREASMIADHAGGRILQRHDPSGRRLRNRIIVANAIAWIVVIALIRLILF
jgi:aspartate oxidase